MCVPGAEPASSICTSKAREWPEKSRDFGALSERLRDKAVKIIDNNSIRNLTVENLMQVYRIQPISQRQDEHLCSLIYRLSKDPTLLEHTKSRPSTRSEKNLIKKL